MKRLTAALCLMAIASFLCVFGSLKAKRLVEINTAEIFALKEKITVGDNSSLSDSYSVISSWDKSHDILCLYMSHQRISEIDDTLSLIPAFISFGEDGAACALCDKAAQQIDEIIKSENISLINIF